MPATRLNLPLKCLIASSDPITASHSLSVERKTYFEFGIISLTPSWVVPSHITVKRLLLLGHGRDAQADAGRDQAVNGVDLLLEDQPPKPLDRILRIGLFLDHQLELASGDAAVLVHPLGGPLHRADTALAGGAGGARSRRNDADPERLVLRQRRREQPGAAAATSPVPASLEKSRRVSFIGASR